MYKQTPSIKRKPFVGIKLILVTQLLRILFFSLVRVVQQPKGGGGKADRYARNASILDLRVPHFLLPVRFFFRGLVVSRPGGVGPSQNTDYAREQQGSEPRIKSHDTLGFDN